MTKPIDTELDGDNAELAQQRLQLENDKLRLEIEQMKQQKSFTDRVEKFLPMLTLAVAVFGLLLSARSFSSELEKANYNRTREARKPFLDRQLQQYFDASDAAAKVATSKIPADREAAKAKFWVLYWGPLAIVEDAGIDKPDGAALVETAMINFGACLDRPEPCSDQELKQRSLLLAHQCRASVSMSWDVKTATLPDKPEH